MEIITTTLSDKKDLVRCNNAVDCVQDFKDKKIKAFGFIIYNKADKDGEIKTVTAIKLEDGFITSISPTIRDSVETIITAYEPEEVNAGIDIIVKSKKSKGGRDFYYLDLA